MRFEKTESGLEISVFWFRSSGKPHIHLEIYKPGAKKPSVNNHIPFVE